MGKLVITYIDHRNIFNNIDLFKSEWVGVELQVDDETLKKLEWTILGVCSHINDLRYKDDMEHNMYKLTVLVNLRDEMMSIKHN
jgi:hypothetical protein